MVTSGAQSKAVSDWAITSLEVRKAKFNFFLMFDNEATPSDLQPTFELEKMVLSQAVVACPSVQWGNTVCHKSVLRLCSEFMSLQSTECGTNVYFRLCLSNKASRRLWQCSFVAVFRHSFQFAYFVMDVNLLRAKHYIENEPGVQSELTIQLRFRILLIHFWLVVA